MIEPPVTVPLPTPEFITVNVYCGDDWATKVAVMLVLFVIVTTQVPVPLQLAPLQPLKVEPMLGVAVKIIDEPAVMLTNEHKAPQLILAPVTTPLPVPAFVTVRLY